MINWFQDTFSSTTTEDDIVKSRSLNITRITGVVLPVLVGISTAIAEVKGKPPFDDPAFQKRLILALLLLIGLVTVADILGRSIASLGAARSLVPVATPLPKPWLADQIKPEDVDIPGHIIAFRASNAAEPTKSGEYLFVPKDTAIAPSWQPVDALKA